MIAERSGTCLERAPPNEIGLKRFLAEHSTKSVAAAIVAGAPRTGDQVTGDQATNVNESGSQTLIGLSVIVERSEHSRVRSKIPPDTEGLGPRP